MADNVEFQSATLATPAAGTTVSSDEAASGQVQRVKLALSADGSDTHITADANGLEVQGPGVAGTPAGGVMSVQGVAGGTVLPVSAAALPLPSGAASLVEQQSQTAHLATIAGDTTDIETAVELLDDTVATTGAAIPAKGLAVSGTDGTNARVLKTDAAGELQVDVLSMPTTTVTGTVAVSGTVTVDGSGVTQPISHAALTELAAAIDTEVQVDVVSSALPSGASTLAEQQTQTGHLATIAGDTTDIETAVELLDDAVATTGSAIPAKGFAVAGTDGTNARILKTDAGGELQVDVLSSALPSGAATLAEQQSQTTHLATIAGNTAPLSVLNDWDEGDRAKVNPIVGQAGVQGGSGSVSATTQRVVLATDVALPTGTNAIGRVGHDITGMGHGVTTVTTAGTDVALAGSTACKRVMIQAQTDNTNYIAVGGSGVDATIATGTGIMLKPGDAVELDIDNLADIFIDSLVNGEGVRYLYHT